MGDGTDVRGLLEALGETMEEGSLGFDEDGRAALDAGGGIVIGIDHLPQTRQLLLHAELGTLIEGREAAGLCRDLLHANLDPAATGGATLGLDRETGTVALFARRGAEDLDVEELDAWLGDFAEAAERWRERIAGPGERPVA